MRVCLSSRFVLIHAPAHLFFFVVLLYKKNRSQEDTHEFEPPTASTGPHTDHDTDRHRRTRDGHTTGEHTPHDDSTREQRESLQQLGLASSELYIQKTSRKQQPDHISFINFAYDIETPAAVE